MPGTYKPFFTIELLHNYFISNECTGVTVTPDAATAQLLSRLKVKWKQVGNKVYFLILSNAGVPFISLNPDMVMRFSITVDDYRFFNYTNLNGKGKGYYYFSNLTNNVLTSVSKNYLSAKIQAYDSGVTYKKGQMVATSGGDCCQATVNAPTTAPDLSNVNNGNTYQLDCTPTAHGSGSGTTYSVDPLTSITNYCWYYHGNDKAFVTDADVIETAGLSYNFLLDTPATRTAISIKAFNPVTLAYDIVMTDPAIYQSYSQAVSSCNVSLEGLSAGRYQVTVNGTDKFLFVDNTLQLTGGISLFEIYANPSLSAYKLTDTDGVLTAPVYSIQFAGQLVYWKYVPISSSTIVTAIVYGNISFNGPGSSTFPGSSELMIPLLEGFYANDPSRTPTITKEYPKATGPPKSNLPMAQVDQLTLLDPTVTDPAAQQYASENYLNY